jgi:hypothetical protein
MLAQDQGFLDVASQQFLVGRHRWPFYVGMEIVV